MIPDAMLLTIAMYLEADELMRFEILSKKFCGLKENLDKEVWQVVCHRRWKDWPRYRWENLRKSHANLTTKTWKQRYLWVGADYSRTLITTEELETRLWYFNFTPESGGRGLETMRKCGFFRNNMFVPGYPPLGYELVVSGQRQWLHIGMFPPHTVDRLANGEWIIKNQNVTFVSNHETEKLTYRERGFQG